MTATLRSIGRVASTLTDRRAAPKQPDEGVPDAWIVLDDDLARPPRTSGPVTSWSW